MKSFTYHIKSIEGIHARPATNIVNAAKQFTSKIEVLLNNKSVDAKRMLALMSLNAKGNDVIEVIINGDDEDLALEKLKSVFDENL